MIKTFECPHCEEGVYYPSMDPNARGRTCEECNGTGEIEVEIEDEEEPNQ